MSSPAATRTGNRGARDGSPVLLTLACVVILVAGAKAASSLIVPMIVAALMTILCVPPIRRLRSIGVPQVVAVLLVALLAVGGIVFLAGVVGESVGRFKESQELYHEKLEMLRRQAEAWLRSWGGPFQNIRLGKYGETIDPSQVFQFVTDLTSSVLNLLGNLVIIALILLFALFEADGLSAKLRRALDDPNADLSDFTQISQKVQGYISIKAGVSLLTGALVALLNWALGVDFPLLWGLVAFLFNFVPSIGSIIAAVPALLLCVILHGFGHFLLLGLGYLAINTVVGNVLEPKWMGRRLGLSTLVVFLSLLLWGWVLGPVGMLLSVPLTVIVKIALEHTDEFRAVAVMLGPAEEGEGEAGGP